MTTDLNNAQNQRERFEYDNQTIQQENIVRQIVCHDQFSAEISSRNSNVILTNFPFKFVYKSNKNIKTKYEKHNLLRQAFHSFLHQYRQLLQVKETSIQVGNMHIHSILIFVHLKNIQQDNEAMRGDLEQIRHERTRVSFHHCAGGKTADCIRLFTSRFS